MKTDLKNWDMIDLLSKRHFQLRTLSDNMWNETHDVYISHSEWSIMARVYKKKPTISYVTKQVDITRQATHKFIKQLESKGLLTISNSLHSKRDKCLRLTTLGEQCVEENEHIKASLVNQIINEIGAEQVAQLQNLLRIDWGL